MVIKILNKKCCSTSSIAKDFFFSFSKHTTHIHLKFSTPSTLKPQRHKHIKIQNKTFFFSNSASCYSSIQSIVQQYKIFFLSLYLNSLRPQRSFSTLQFLHFSPLESLVLLPLKIASAGPVLSRKNHYSFVLSFSPPIK